VPFKIEKIMKSSFYKFSGVLLIFIASVFTASASHYTAGEIFYKWIGNEPGKGQFDYRVYVTLYERQGGINIGTNAIQGCAFRSSIGAASAIGFSLQFLSPNLPLPPEATLTATNPHGWLPGGPIDPATYGGTSNGWAIPGFEGCASLATTTADRQAEFRYMGEVTLTGRHSDWKFGINGLSARPAASTYANLAGSGNFYIEADLNNTFGPNSSPRIISPAAKVFCATTGNQLPFNWFQTAGEIDGDSLTYGFYDNGACVTGFGQCGQGCNPVPFSSGFSATNPLPTPPGQPAIINQRLGIFTFSITGQGNYSVVIEVEERRFDTLSLTYQYIGNTVREMIIPVVTNCSAISRNGPTINYSGGGGIGASDYDSLVLNDVQLDSLKDSFASYVIRAADSTQFGANYGDYIIPVYKGYDCFDTRVTMNFDTKVLCGSAVPTDFRLIGPDGVARPVVDVDTKCGLDGASDEIDLILHQALDIDGYYMLQIRRGNDGNTLENECGFELFANYTILVEVTGCPQPNYELQALSVVQDKWLRLVWDGNADLSDTNVENTWNEWQILRADAGQRPFKIVGVSATPGQRSYLDSGFGNNGYYVDNIKFDYAIRAVYNQKGREISRVCNNIVLQPDLDRSGETNLQLNWTPYNCIGDSVLEYNVYRGAYDTINGNTDWEFIVATADTAYDLSRPQPDSLNEGRYAVRVVARRPGSSTVVDSSESNWIFYDLQYFPPPPPPEDPDSLIVPNVFTPNGDLQNDRFYIKSIDPDGRQFESMSFTVYNRWGNKVFEDANYQDRNNPSDGWDGTGNNGGTLAEGVYYYILEVNDPPTGTSDVYKGNLTLLRGGF
jgi:gliding motility-associated-like protein